VTGRLTGCVLAAGALLAGACSAGGGRHATARLQGFRYADSSGLTVTSDGVELEQPVAGGVVVHGSGLVEEIVTPAGASAPDDGGHQHLTALARARPDVITTASSIASTGAPGQKRRVEGNLGVLTSRRVGDVPVDVDVRLRTSQEPDYLSTSGSLAVSADLLDRNLAVAAFGGYGVDTVSPVVKPTGQDALWPARHQRVNGGFAVTQLLSSELAVSGGASVNYQFGRLANPYRRALASPTLNPDPALGTLYGESVPSERLRGTAFARVAWWLGGGTALHVRQGFYADDWGVRSLVPELTLACELGRRGLFLARGRLYWQSSGSFYQPVYRQQEPLMSGDVRLGRVREQLVGAELRWTFIGDVAAGAGLQGTASYDRSWITYPDVTTRITADVLSLALVATF
jgi:hypothetical protein